MADAGDYRASHLEKGYVYDSTLAKEPFGNYSEAIQKALIRRFVDSQFGGRIPRHLDFACGTGRMTSFFAPLSAESFGVDVSETMLAEARRKCPTTTFFVRDLTRDDIDLAPVDVVSAFRFFGNAQDSLRREALVAIHRRLAPGGFLIINNHRNPLSLQYLAHRMGGGTERLDLTYFKMRRLLRSSGFSLVRTWGIGWWCALARLTSASALQSGAAGLLEPLSRVSPVGWLCPDMLIIARKAH